MTFEDDRYLVLKERNKMSIFLLLCLMLNMLLKLNLKNFEEIIRVILFM